jgi:hypothetical protein
MNSNDVQKPVDSAGPNTGSNVNETSSDAENGSGSSYSDADAAKGIWPTQEVVDFANNFSLTSPKPTAFNTKEAQLTDQICQKVKPASNRRDQGTPSHLNHALYVALPLL